MTRTQIQDQFIVQFNSVLRRADTKCGLTVGSERRQDGCCDQLLHRRLHPPLSIDHPGSLRQTATELVVPPWTTGGTPKLIRKFMQKKKKSKKISLPSYNTCHEDRHVETLDVLRDATAARLRWWTRVVSEKQQWSSQRALRRKTLITEI